MSPARFEGKGFVITGGCHGLGPAVVLAAAREGANVIFSGCSKDRETAAEIVAASRVTGVAERVSFVAADVSSETDVDRLFDTVFERLPALHVLINIVEAEAVPQATPLVEISLADWNRALTANLGEPFLLSRRAIQEFLAGGEGGRIVHIVSTSAYGAAMPASYAASQSALRALTRSIVKEYGSRGIACNAVIIQGGLEPKTVPLHIIERCARDSFPSHRLLGQPEAVLEAVLFLASDEASFVSGELLVVESAPRAERPDK